MKTLKILTLMLSLTLLPLPAFANDLGRARMSFVQGDVQINSEETGEWFPASVNTPLREGDRLWIPPEGRSEIQILGGFRIRLDAATSFDILSLGEGATHFYLQQGRAYISNQRYGIDHFQIDTPLSSIGCYNDSTVMVDVAESGATELSVLKGYAYAETRNGKIRVNAGNTLVIGENLAAELYPLGPPDEWEQWNRDRDTSLARGGAGSSYLPDELRDYAADFEGNGRWLYTPDYGNVWTPFVSVSVGWAPYKLGRWVWFGGNYVWISYEPWGWAPYHYGRWAYLPRVGWCWVPPRRGAVYWAPGYVAWVHSSTFVSWVPLAPGDIYYGYGYYGPGSVNINVVNINKIVIVRNYINMNVRNAVTSIHRDTFLHGVKRDFSIKENPFRLVNVGIGPPRFKPDKAGMSPVIRKVPAAKLPPPRVRTFNPDLIRKERRLVRDERGSVFTPGKPLKEMPAIRREAPKKLMMEQKPDRYRDLREKMREETLPKQERRMRQPDMIGPFGTDRPESTRETPPVFTPTTPRKAPAPAVEPKPGVKREEILRDKSAPERVAPSGTTSGNGDKSDKVKRPRIYAPQQPTVPVAPQPVAPTPVWRPQRPQQPQGQGPEAAEPAPQSRSYYHPGSETPRGDIQRLQQPRSVQQPQVTQPSEKPETVRRQAAPGVKQESRQQSGAAEGAPSRTPNQGDWRLETR